METEMDNRGSKSGFYLQSDPVKEQRVDGNWSIAKQNNMLLRCTLMGFERNYPVKAHTNQWNNRSYSTKQINPISVNINPWFITGFSEAEGSFIISMYKNEHSKLKWRVTPNFTINIDIKDIALLQSIKDTFGVGNVRKNSSNTAVYRVDNIQELQVIVDHFYKYSLIGDKGSDFLLFKQGYDLIKQKQHLIPEGLEKIVALNCHLNKGLTDVLMEAFPNISAIPRPLYKFYGIPDPNWISGFVSGDSTFCVSIEKSTNKIGKRVRLIFGTCLQLRDKVLLTGMADYLYKNNRMTGKYIYDSEDKNRTLLQIKNFSDIVNIIIPFFNKYPILGVKSLDFADFKSVAELMIKKEHLTSSGLSEIVNIVAKMNVSRTNF